MSTITINSVAFADVGHGRTAKVEIAVAEPEVVAALTLTVVLKSHDRQTGVISTHFDEEAVVREARRKLHHFATSLAEATKDWAAP